MIGRVPCLGYRAANAKQTFRDELIDHRRYVERRGGDPPAIRG